MKNEKKFLIPEAEIFNFTSEDIITGSGDSPWGGNANLGDIPGPNVP